MKIDSRSEKLKKGIKEKEGLKKIFTDTVNLIKDSCLNMNCLRTKI